MRTFACVLGWVLMTLTMTGCPTDVASTDLAVPKDMASNKD